MTNRLINRNTKTITFSLPPEMAEQVQDVMRDEGRTMSELIREALRNYMEEAGVAAGHPVREAPGSPCRAGRLTGRLKEDSMNKKHLQPLTPAAFYARVSSDRQDVDLSVSAQLRALKDSAAREYVDEAESGRVADRPQFRKMIDEGSKPTLPFEVILVWKFSRFTRKREHAVAFKSMLMKQMQSTQVLLQGSPG